MKRRTRNTGLRLVILASFFCVVCVVYLVRLGSLQLGAAAREARQAAAEEKVYKRTEVVQAQRGEIYDRNGVALVTNRYYYDLELDIQALPEDNTARNDVVLRALAALSACGKLDQLGKNYNPFTGTYPDLAYSAEALDPESAIHTRLTRVVRLAELRRDKTAADQERDVTEAVPASQLAAYLCKKYGLTDRKGNALYTEENMAYLLRVWYNAEALDFGYLANYVLAEDVGMDTVTYVLEQALPGVTFSTRAEREYAYPGYASHLLGQVGKITAETWDYYKERGYNMNDSVGLSGCEAAFESYLRGQDGVRVICEDADGNVVDEYMKSAPVAGGDVYLTIDILVQIAAEDGLRENTEWVRKNGYSSGCFAGALVAMDPDTGEILAAASCPTYDLTTYNKNYDQLAADENNPLLNRAFNGVYTPGSVFKLGMAAAGLALSPTLADGSSFTASSRLECAGTYTYYSSYQPDCWIYNSASSPHGKHGFINVGEALRVSCNCFFYELGRVMGIESMNRFCRIYGLGSATGLELSEKTGILAGPDYRLENGLKDWQPTDTIVAAIGQSENTFTPLQISLYLSTLLNGGTRYNAHLLQQVRSFDGTEVLYATPVEAQAVYPFRQSDLRVIAEAMRSMVDTSSTVSGFMYKDAGIPVIVGGKSGTAQTGRSTDNALFVSAAPYDDPEIVVAAVLEKGAGGSYASLSCARTIRAYYDSLAKRTQEAGTESEPESGEN